MIGQANHTYRSLLGDRAAKIDTHDLPGLSTSHMAKHEQAAELDTLTVILRLEIEVGERLSTKIETEIFLRKKKTTTAKNGLSSANRKLKLMAKKHCEMNRTSD